MELEKILEKNKKSLLRKCFVDQNGNVYTTNEYEMHEMLAMKICDAKGWIDWNNYYDSAEEYLIHMKAFIKVANYEEYECAFHYVAISKKHEKTKKIRKTANFISDILGVEILLEEDPRSINKSTKYIEDSR